MKTGVPHDLHIRPFLQWVGIPQTLVFLFLWVLRPDDILSMVFAVMGFQVILYALIIAMDRANARAASLGGSSGGSKS